MRLAHDSLVTGAAHRAKGPLELAGYVSRKPFMTLRELERADFQASRIATANQGLERGREEMLVEARRRWHLARDVAEGVFGWLLTWVAARYA